MKTVIGCVLILLLVLPAGQSLYGADKTRIAVTNFNLSFLPLGVALQRGFFKDEGLDVEVIRMNTPNTVAAMITCDVVGTIDVEPSGGNVGTESEDGVPSASPIEPGCWAILAFCTGKVFEPPTAFATVDEVPLSA